MNENKEKSKGKRNVLFRLNYSLNIRIRSIWKKGITWVKKKEASCRVKIHHRRNL